LFDIVSFVSPTECGDVGGFHMPGIDECLAEAMTITGVFGASLVDWSSGLLLGSAGRGPDGDHETAAAETTELARATIDSATFTTAESGKSPVEDIIVTTGSGYHLLRFVDTAFDSSVFFYLWLDGAANLAMARIRLRIMADNLVLV
jgi:hypothetical protein